MKHLYSESILFLAMLCLASGYVIQVMYGLHGFDVSRDICMGPQTLMSQVQCEKPARRPDLGKLKILLYSIRTILPDANSPSVQEETLEAKSEIVMDGVPTPFPPY